MRLVGIILLSSLAIYSLYLVISIALGIPSGKSSGLIWDYDKPTRKSKTGYAALVNRISVQLLKFVHIEEYRRENMKRALALLGYSEDYTPEEFLASKIINYTIRCLVYLLFIFVMPIIAVILCSVESVKLYKSITKLNTLLENQTKAIDKEMVNFVQTIRQELSKDNDVDKCMVEYSKYASKSFRIELDKAIATMKEGKYEKALIELDRRVNSNKLGQVTRAMISVIHGADAKYTLDLLCTSFETAQAAELDILAEETGAKAERYAMYFIFLVAFLFLGGFGLLAYFEYKKSGVSL